MLRKSRVHKMSAGVFGLLLGLFVLLGAVPAYSQGIVIDKQVDADTAHPGDVLTYRVTILNVGVATVSRVESIDALPQLTEYVPGSATTSSGTVSYQAGKLEWTLTDLAVADTAVLEFRARIDSTITDTVTVNNFVFVPGGSALYANAATLVIPYPPFPELTIVKSVDLTSAYPGDTLEYTLTITNVDEIDADEVVIEDFVSYMLEYLPGSAGDGVYDDVLEKLTWNIGALAAGGDTTVSFRAVIYDNAQVGEVIENTAAIIVPDTVTSNTVYTEIIPIPIPELTIEKSVDLTSAYPGDTLEYTLTITNVDEFDADEVVVEDFVSYMLEYLPGSAGDGTYEDAVQKLTWNVGALAAGDDTTVSFRAVIYDNAQVGEVIENTAAIIVPDTVTSNTVYTEIIPIPTPELTIHKGVSARTVYPGDTLEYTLVVANVGTVPAYGVSVEDTLPLLTGFVPGSAGNGIYDEQTGIITWQLGDMVPTDTVELSFRADVNVDAPVGNSIANAGSIITPDTVVSNTVYTDIIERPVPVLHMTKSASADTAFAGDTITYTITVSNAGEYDAADIQVMDTVPGFTTYVGGSVTAGGVYDEQANCITWQVGDLAVNENFALMFRAAIDGAAPDYQHIENIAHLTAPDTALWDTAMTVVVPPPPPPMLDISKAVDSSEASPGSIMRYSLTVTNTGEGAVTEVIVTDAVPELTSYVAGSASHGGQYDAGAEQVGWTVGSLEVDESITLTFEVGIDADIVFEDTAYNAAHILSPVDKTSNEVETIIRIKTGSEDLVLTKGVNLAEAAPATVLTYSLTLTNTGPDLVADVSIVDTIPALTSYVAGSLSGDGGYSFDGTEGIVTWVIGDMSPFSTVTLEFRVRIASAATDGTVVRNQAFIATPDVIPGNEVTTIVRILPPPEIELRKEASLHMASIGDVVWYRVHVKNVGAGAIYQALIEDHVPDNFLLTGEPRTAEGDPIPYTPGDILIMELGQINPGDSLTLVYPLTIQNDAAIDQWHTNVAWLQGRDFGGNVLTFGPVQATVMLTAPQLHVTKTAGSPSGQVGDIVRYTITVENTANVTAHDVSVYDEMPVGFFYENGSTYIDGAPAADAAGTNPYHWYLGDLDPGDKHTIDFTVLLGTSVQGGIQENRAWAISIMQPGELRSNIAVAQISVVPSTLHGAIRGRVIIDCDGDGLADADETIPPIDIYLDDGSQSRANKMGMFYFSTVRAGEHVVTLDERDIAGYVLSDDQPASVFSHVHETGEAYITFRLCPALSVDKQAAIVPRVRVTKAATINAEHRSDTTGVLIDYEISIESNGGVDPTTVRVVDSFPQETRLIVHERQTLTPEQNNNQLTYEVMVQAQRLHQTVYYSLEDLSPGIRRFLTNRIHLEGSPVVASETTGPFISEATEVSVGPFGLIPPEDIEIDVIGAQFITSKADLLPEAIPILGQLADSAKKYDGAMLRIEGHADVRRIHTKQFPSNWELSTARAKSVVDWLASNGGVVPERMTYEGFAATRPVDPANNLVAYAKNRRVEVFITAKTKSHVDMSGITAKHWQASTLLELLPVAWDSVIVSPENAIEAGFDDTWEIRIRVENTGKIQARGMTVSDRIPDGMTFVEGSATVDGVAMMPVMNGDGTLSWTLESIAAEQVAEIHYRVVATGDSLPAGANKATADATAAGGFTLTRTSNNVTIE